MNFSEVKSLVIPEGAVKQIADANGNVLWKKAESEENAYTFVGSLDIPTSGKIDTGVACNSMDYLYVDFAPLADSIYGTVVYAGTSKIMRFYIDGRKLQAKVDWYNSPIATITSGTRYKAVLLGQKAKLNGTQVVDMSGVPAFDANTNVMVGGLGNRMRLWGVQHGTSENSLDLDMVPAVRNSDQTAGLYDKVSGAFTPFGAVTGG